VSNKKITRESRYEERAQIKEFKRSLNVGVRKRLIKSELSSKIIVNWYKRAIVLDCH